MPRLRSAQGVVVNVSDDKAARLGSSWEPVQDEQPAPKKTTAKRSTGKSS